MTIGRPWSGPTNRSVAHAARGQPRKRYQRPPRCPKHGPDTAREFIALYREAGVSGLDAREEGSGQEPADGSSGDVAVADD